MTTKSRAICSGATLSTLTRAPAAGPPGAGAGRSADERALGRHADDAAPLAHGQGAGRRHGAHAADEHEDDDDVLAAFGQVGRNPGGQAHRGEGAGGLEQDPVQGQVGELEQQEGGRAEEFIALNHLLQLLLI